MVDGNVEAGQQVRTAGGVDRVILPPTPTRQFFQVPSGME